MVSGANDPDAVLEWDESLYFNECVATRNEFVLCSEIQSLDDSHKHAYTSRGGAELISEQKKRNIAVCFNQNIHFILVGVCHELLFP